MDNLYIFIRLRNGTYQGVKSVLIVYFSKIGEIIVTQSALREEWSSCSKRTRSNHNRHMVGRKEIENTIM
jgi:hypothetical protein